ncbi:MAG: hypothetical protein RIS70_3162 [Planctomycetota bacterium]
MVQARARIDRVAMTPFDAVAGVAEAVAAAGGVGISALMAVVRVMPAVRHRAVEVTMSHRTLIERLTSVDRNPLTRSQHRKRWKMSSTRETMRAKRAATRDAGRPDRVHAKDNRVRAVRTFSDRGVAGVDVGDEADAGTTHWNLDRAMAAAAMRSRTNRSVANSMNSMATSAAMRRATSQIVGTSIVRTSRSHPVSMKMRKVWRQAVTRIDRVRMRTKTVDDRVEGADAVVVEAVGVNAGLRERALRRTANVQQPMIAMQTITTMTIVPTITWIGTATTDWTATPV